MRGRVSPQIHFPVEGPRADGADEGLVSRVLPAVRDEVGRLAERLPALGALVRLLARVDVRVLLHVGLLVKPLAAVLARKRARVRVDEHVRGERGGALEALAALLALEHLLVRVDRLVLLEANRVPERLLAQVALVGSFPGVRPANVHLEAVGRGEHLLALDAVERLGTLLLGDQRFPQLFPFLSFRALVGRGGAFLRVDRWLDVFRRVPCVREDLQVSGILARGRVKDDREPGEQRGEDGQRFGEKTRREMSVVVTVGH